MKPLAKARGSSPVPGNMSITFPHQGNVWIAIASLLDTLKIDYVIPEFTNKRIIGLGVANSPEWVCVTGNTEITIDDFTSKPIQEIKIEEKVLTHKGRFRKVTNILSRQYNGKILKIDCGGKLNLVITPDHMIYGLKRKSITCHKSGKQLPIICRPERKSFYCINQKSCKEKEGLIDFAPKFIPAKDLKKGDLIAIPVPSIIEDKSFLEWKEEYCPSSSRFKINRFDYSPELMMVLGYWLAEGSFSKNFPREDNQRKQENKSGIVFAFSSKEDRYINEIANIIKKNFDCSFSFNNREQICAHNLLIWGKALANIFFYLCGEYCIFKKLHKDILYLPPKKQLEILKGFWRGDGHFDKGKSYSGTTTSWNLANQFFWILIRNNIKPSFFSGKQRGRKPHYTLKLFSNEDIQKIDDSINTIYKIKDSSGYIKKTDHLLVPIKKITKEEFNGEVYNLEVEEDNSYVANFLAIHNCYPYKVVTGHMIDGLQKGADKILMVGGAGRGVCRLAYYPILQEQILKKAGYKFEMINLSGNLDNIRRFLKQIKKSSAIKSRLPLVSGVSRLLYKLKVSEYAENAQRKIRAYETTKGETSKVYKECLDMLHRAETLKDIRRAQKGIKERFDSIEQDKDGHPLKVGIIGEFFCVLDSYVNNNIEEKLGYLGCEVCNEQSNFQLVKAAFRLNPKRKIREIIGSKYFPVSTGGEDRQTLSKTEIYGKRGYDGVVLIEPFACMPEGNARCILPYISKKFNIPSICFAIDENFSPTLMNTRIEAFVEMLIQKQNRRTKPDLFPRK